MPINWTKLIRRKFVGSFPLWNFVEYALLRAGMALINFFPARVSTWASRRIGDIIFLILPGRRKVAISNLTIAFGNTKSDREKTSLALESFRNLATCFMEFSRIPKFLKVAESRIHFKGTEHMREARKRGRGLILIMSHLGPWEYLGFLAHHENYIGTILGRPIRNPYIYKWFKSLRELMGLKYSDKDGSPKVFFSELRQNHGLAIAIDQWAGNEGIWIDFFGTPTSTTAIPARIAKKTGCTLLPGYCIRVASGKYEIHIEPGIIPVKDDPDWVENATKQLNRLLEEKIRAFPEQWTWTHKRWKNKRHIR